MELKNDLWKVEKDENNKKMIKVQAKRKRVAWRYEDGKRARKPKTSNIKNYKAERDTRKPRSKDFVWMPKPQKGKWPDNVKLEYRKKFWPTEESLAHIYFYQESEKSEYDKKKTEKVLPILNKILILEKEDNIEYVVDRFVSF